MSSRIQDLRTTALNSKAFLLCVLLVAGPSLAGEVGFAGGGGGFFGVPVKSLKEARFQSVVRQQYDFSCGSAAISTLLAHHYEREISEDLVFHAMWENGDKERIRKVGFSLLDMKDYLATIGLESDGFRISVEDLSKEGVPGITMINTKDFHHFVVVSGLDLERGDVLIADPSLGIRAMPIDEFKTIWNGIFFVVKSEASVGRAHFNSEENWAVRPEAPSGGALSRATLSTLTMNLPGLNQF